jgi:branched-chain amino acid transport system ATP-binding protein
VTDAVLIIDKLVVAFEALKAVDGVSISISRGERRAIIGPNGAGKTTLFNAATGVVRPTHGRIVFDGRDITRLPPHRRARLGISRTFQITNLFPTLSVSDNVALAVRGLNPQKLSLFGSPQLSVKEAAAITVALTAVRLSDCVDAQVRELCYGEQRQLEIALALVTGPSILLLDEPAAGLSPAERSIVAQIIRSLQRDLTLIMIEHDMDLALGLVDYVTCMHEGRILAAKAAVPRHHADSAAGRRATRCISQQLDEGLPHITFQLGLCHARLLKIQLVELRCVTALTPCA